MRWSSVLDLLRVHAGRRLVEQQQLGLGGERAGKLQPALLAERQVGGEVVALVGEAGELQQLADARAVVLEAVEPARHHRLRCALAVAVLRHPQVLPHSELAEEADVLEGAGDRPSDDERVARQPGHVAPVDHDAAGGRRQEAGDDD